jgi:hypothetical protein
MRIFPSGDERASFRVNTPTYYRLYQHNFPLLSKGDGYNGHERVGGSEEGGVGIEMVENVKVASAIDGRAQDIPTNPHKTPRIFPKLKNIIKSPSAY